MGRELQGGVLCLARSRVKADWPVLDGQEEEGRGRRFWSCIANWKAKAGLDDCELWHLKLIICHMNLGKPDKAAFGASETVARRGGGAHTKTGFAFVMCSICGIGASGVSI